MVDRRRLNEVCPCIGGLPSNRDKVNWSIVGYIGSGKQKERVYLEEDIEFSLVDWRLSKWKEKLGVRWDVLQMNMNGVQVNSVCPNCKDDNEALFTKYLDGKYKPLDGDWTPYASDFGGSGYITIKCAKCKTVYNMDISS